MPTPKFPGIIKDGKPILDNLPKYRAYLSAFKEGTRVDLILKKQTKKRSNKQNKYYWHVVIEILREYFGYSKDEMHEALKWQFLRKPDSNPPTVGSTRKLSTEEFNTYIESIQIWAASEFSVVVPDPNEVDE